MLPCTRPSKAHLKKTIIRPIVIYGAESHTLTNKMVSVLITRERKILRKIYGPTYETVTVE
jgi:hypothetical protein